MAAVALVLGFWDFDHDGYPDLYVANGYISGPVQMISAASLATGGRKIA